MEISDICIVLILAVFGIRGLFNGFLSEISSLLGLVLGFIFAVKYNDYVANILIEYHFFERYADIIGFIIMFLAVYIGFMLTAFVLKKFVNFIKLAWLDKIGGGAFGVVKGGILIGVILSLILSHLLQDEEFSKEIKEAPVTSFILETTPKFFAIVDEYFKLDKEGPLGEFL